MPRLNPPPPDQLSASQKRIYDTITSGPRGCVPGPLGLWLHRPELAEKAQALGQYCRYETLLEPRLSELAILTTARVWRANYEWAVHKPFALKAGLSAAVIEAIRVGKTPAFEHADEEVTFTYARTLHTERHIGDELYARAVAVLGEPAVVDLTGLLGYYTLISMTINAFDIPLPDGMEPELE